MTIIKPGRMLAETSAGNTRLTRDTRSGGAGETLTAWIPIESMTAAGTANTQKKRLPAN